MKASAAALAAVGVALAFGGLARSAAAPAPSFAQAQRYASGKEPVSVAIADLSADGKPDLATANRTGGTVSVFLNRGNGRFAAKRDYASGKAPYAVSVADLNGDGKPDLVTTKLLTKASLSVFMNRGDGSFEPKRDYPVDGSNVAIGDLNGDGRPELVTESYSTSTASVLVNHGDGTFEARRDYATGKKPDVAAIGDVNGDGKLDLLTRNDSTVSVLLNRGDASFEAKHDYASSDGGGSLEIVDLNGDGNPDLVFDSYAPVGSVSVMLNAGDGTFRRSRDYMACWYEDPCFDNSQSSAVDEIGIADLNADGRPDIAAKMSYELLHQDYEGVVSVFLNRGDGTFRDQRSYRTGSANDLSVSQERLAISDLNGDGRPELVTADFGLSMLLNRGDGSFRSKLDYPGGGLVAARDLNADAKPDLLTTGSGSVRVRINTPGLCNVQYVVGMTLAGAKRKLARGNCRVGKIRHVYANPPKKGRVFSQKPGFGAVLPGGGKVNLAISKGRLK
jgi:hypothetical protein